MEPSQARIQQNSELSDSRVGDVPLLISKKYLLWRFQLSDQNALYRNVLTPGVLSRIGLTQDDVRCRSFRFDALQSAELKRILFGVLLLLLLATTAPAQTEEMKSDTIYGVSVVIDTLRIQYFKEKPVRFQDISDTSLAIVFYEVEECWRDSLITSVWPAYSITNYRLVVTNMGNAVPQIHSVWYYRLSDCAIIPNRRILQFKQI